VYEEALDIPNV